MQQISNALATLTQKTVIDRFQTLRDNVSSSNSVYSTDKILERAEGKGMTLYHGRILYVEDHEDTREMVAVMMRMWGYRMTVASTLAEGLRLAREGSYDLYLFDGKLPDGSGVELCKQVREFDNQTPIIFYSASAFDVNKEQATAAGAQGYLPKPADPVELELMVADWIDKRFAGIGTG
jgi:CheY-like chemotaxis protein